MSYGCALISQRHAKLNPIPKKISLGQSLKFIEISFTDCIF